MSFEARVYIQGVAVYVPQEDGTVTVLFPDHIRANEHNVRDCFGHEIREHHAVVQFDAWNVGALPEALRSRRIETSDATWSGVDASGYLLKIAAKRANGAKPATDLLDDNGRVPGIPHLPEIMRWAELDQVSTAPRKGLLADSAISNLLRAALVIDAGVLSPASDFDGAFYIIDPAKEGRGRRLGPPAAPDAAQPAAGKKRRPVPRRPDAPELNFSSVLKLELGEVEGFRIELYASASDPPAVLEFTPPYDELDVWIRHFCILERPDPAHVAESDHLIDVDFALNYALLEDLTKLLALPNRQLPVPEIAPSWAGGGPVGDETLRCMGTGG